MEIPELAERTLQLWLVQQGRRVTIVEQLAELIVATLVGDAQEVRNVMGAVWDGYEVARAI
jgi:hypothetical protein